MRDAALRFPGNNRAACEAIAGVRDGVLSHVELRQLPVSQLRYRLEHARSLGWQDGIEVLFAGIPDDDQDLTADGAS